MTDVDRLIVNKRFRSIIETGSITRADAGD